jgi:hypothetical protein
VSENIYDHTFSTPVDPAFGFSRIAVRITVPKFPSKAATASFSEHVYDRTQKCATRSVIAVRRGGVSISNDLGDDWEHIDLTDQPNADFVHCITLSDGTHLVQGRSPRRTGSKFSDALGGAIFRYSVDWNFLGEAHPGESHWHGSRSADEAGGVVMFADYPSNKNKSEVDIADPNALDKHDVRVSKVYRSLDGGRNWTKVFSQSRQEIRHFHTLIADPFVPRTWWLSSGDNARECHVWLSADDGDSWREVSNSSLAVDLHPRARNSVQSVFRHTDMWIGEHEICWGTDDWLGGCRFYDDPIVPVGRRVGSRMYRAEKKYPLSPKLIGHVGNPVRSIIDIGPACIGITEAKQNVLTRPQVFLFSKHAPDLLAELFTVDVFKSGGTGFTFSRASRATCDDTFFTFRSRYDLVDAPTRIARWHVAFD